MGVYLSSPLTEKTSSDKQCKKFTYGASSMQGWRVTQEDAHNCIPEFDEDTALFAVYDGHGGADVAQYCAIHFPDYIKQTETYIEGGVCKGLEDAFLGFDQTLTEPDVIKELKQLAGVDEDADENQAGAVPASRDEANILRAEAEMPLEDVLALYDTVPCAPALGRKFARQKFLSPMRQAKHYPSSHKAGGDAQFTEANRSVTSQSGEGNSVSGGGNSSVSSQSGEGISIGLPMTSKLANGHADNDNNLNIEKEISQSSASTSEVNICGPEESEADNAESDASHLNGKEDKIVYKKSTDNSVGTALSTSEQDSCKPSTADSTADLSSNVDAAACVSNTPLTPGKAPCPSPNTEDCKLLGNSGLSRAHDQHPESSSPSSAQDPKDPHPELSSSSSTEKDPQPQESSSSSCAQPGGNCSSEEPRPGGSGEVEPKAGSSSGLTGVLDMEDSDDSDDSESEKQWSTDDDQSEDSDEDDEEELEDIEGMTNKTADFVSHEEPGSDSGCTAVLAVLKGRRLVVANAGDSRCVLCRNGKAIDLSFDHKPEDLPEMKRIENAGGKVTADGRVNGGLNLSRAIGDHFYKKNSALPPKDQMITAFPEIYSTTVGYEDQFMILACDGIWNYMDSQEVVDFVLERLKDPLKREKPSLICEEIFDHCLAPNTMGDGTGCDNMTCILVVFDDKYQAAGPFVEGFPEMFISELQVEDITSGSKRTSSVLDYASYAAMVRLNKRARLTCTTSDNGDTADSPEKSMDNVLETQYSPEALSENSTSKTSVKEVPDETVSGSDDIQPSVREQNTAGPKEGSS